MAHRTPEIDYENQAPTSTYRIKALNPSRSRSIEEEVLRKREYGKF